MVKKDDGLSGADVKKMAAKWHGIELSDARAAGLAGELNGLNAATRSAARNLPYDVEPSGFTAALTRLKHKRGA